MPKSNKQTRTAKMQRRLSRINRAVQIAESNLRCGTEAARRKAFSEFEQSVRDQEVAERRLEKLRFESAKTARGVIVT